MTAGSSEKFQEVLPLLLRAPASISTFTRSACPSPAAYIRGIQAFWACPTVRISRRPRNAATAPAVLTDAVVVGTKRTGLEPATSAVTGLRSNQTELPLLCRLLTSPFRFPVRVGCGGIIQIFSGHCKLFLQKKRKKGEKNAISGQKGRIQIKIRGASLGKACIKRAP